MLFGSGSYGKKKIDSVNKGSWKPDFVAWNESTCINNEHTARLFKKSVYQNDFCVLNTPTQVLTRLPSSIANKLASNSTVSLLSTASGATGTSTASNKLLTSRKNVDSMNSSSRPCSVYNYNYNHNEPSVETSKETQKETYYRFIAKNSLKRAKSCAPERNSVANCLVWHDRIKPAAAAATATEALTPPPPPTSSLNFHSQNNLNTPTTADN